MGPLLIIIGMCIALLGGVLTLLSRSGVSLLLGDIFVQKGNLTVFFPIVTCIVISIVLTIVLNLFKK
jgi:hypothetical protein